MNSCYRRIIFKNEEIFHERHKINNTLSTTVVMYCVGLPLPRPDVNPVTDMYNWYLSTFKRQLEVVSKIIELLRCTPFTCLHVTTSELFDVKYILFIFQIDTRACE